MKYGSVYLGGPITGLSYDGCVNWREEVRAELEPLGITAFSPMRHKGYLRGVSNIMDGYQGTVLSCDRGITTRDRFDCQRCNLFFVNLLGTKKVTIGTMIEYGWADGAYPRIPAITVMEDEGNLHDHAMVREITGFRVNNLKDGVNLIKHILLPREY